MKTNHRSSLALLISTSVLWPALAAAQTTLTYPPAPVAVDKVAAAMTVPDGFKVTLFAGEPDVVQPIAFTFDDRGRMWVAECLSYPKWTKDGTGRDRIVILEDTNGDGVHDKRTVFADNLANLSGLEYGFGGVFICSLPTLKFIPDRNGDDVPDGPAETVLDGWDENCRHNVFNGLAWGPDGWLYGLNGILSRSKVGPPGATDAERKYMDCGVWRYHPTRREFEPYAFGTTNPWGLDWDDYGEMFITNCVIKHLFHVTPGGHYERMFGADPNPHVYGLMQSCADHIHWAGGHWTESRGGAGAHSDAGGGHAHSGCSVYLGDNFPAEYRNNVFMCNIHGNRLNRDSVEREGSGYTAHHEKDFLFANDPWHRGLVVKYGPDGGLYVADWCDTGECHNYEVADVTNGRIVKVMYIGDAPQPPPFLHPFGDKPAVPPKAPYDLATLSDQELVHLQLHRNEYWVRHARRILQERAAAKKLDADTIEGLHKLYTYHGDVTRKLRALWVLHAVGGLKESNYMGAIGLEKEPIAGWAVTLACERPMAEAEPGKFLSKNVLDLMEHSVKYGTPNILDLKVAAGAQRLTDGGGHVLATAMAALSFDELIEKPVKDGNRRLSPDDPLTLMIWYATESAHARRVAGLESPNQYTDVMTTALSSAIPLVRRNAARHWMLTMNQAPNTPEKAFATLLEQARNHPTKAEDVCTGMIEALRGTRDVKRPADWTDTFAVLGHSPSAKVRAAAQQLAVIFGDELVIDGLRGTLVDATAEAADRRRALELLVAKRLPGLSSILLKLIDDSALRSDALKALAAFDDVGTGERIIGKFSQLSEAEKLDALQTLASRPSYALALLDAVEAGRINRRDVSSGVAVQIAGLKNKAVQERLAKVWGSVRPTSEARKQQMERLKQVLSPTAVAAADAKQGRALFTKHCSACHKLFGEGGKIGPELTGSQRANVEYVLENVVDPSAKVGRLYQVSVLELNDGRVVQGVISDENDLSVTVQTANEQLVIAKSEIDARQQTSQSLMPDGLFDKLNDGEIRNLMAYLASSVN